MSAKTGLCDAALFFLAFLIVIAVGVLIVHGWQKKPSPYIAPIETITRFTMEIEDRDTARKMSRVVECLRHEHHVQQTSSTAC